MKKIVYAAAFATVLTATPALAQEQVGDRDQLVSGPRVEATAGWDNIKLSALGDSGSKSGFTYGGEAGYDVVIGTSALIGGYVGIDGSTTEECIADGTERGCIKAGRNFTAGARIGFAAGSNALIYGKGGYSNGRLTIDYRDTAFPADNFRESGDVDGFHVGGGLQLGLSRGVYGKVEYNYTNYSVDDEDFGIDLERHRVLAGVGIRF